ncbi:MAG: CRISPR-associated endonuclease Cas2 [Myxococcales bacterium]|nr:CRISPR-associated endonuclease Cas2 [Myxococcota bacterium]MDW8284373.1 CRISPR-associated endonuclease Cas2 [Myxococcales bacterium]
MNRRLYLVCYDVVDDGRRERLSRLLESVGRRVQWSVFEVLLDRTELEALLGQAREPARFNAAEDSLRCYPLCAECLSGVRIQGQGSAPLLPNRPLVL